MTIQVQIFTRTPLSNNNYVVLDSDSHEAVLIDCSEPADDIMEYIQQQGCQLKYVLLTHAHFDHVLGVQYFQDKYHVPVYGSRKDQTLLNHINDYTTWLKLPKVKVPKLDGYLEDQNLTLGQYPIKVIATPGHTEGCVCYLIQNLLFSGDTLFKGSYGRTDFPGGSVRDIQKSLHMLFDTLSDDVVVYPGHGAATTIKSERALYK